MRRPTRRTGAVGERRQPVAARRSACHATTAGDAVAIGAAGDAAVLRRAADAMVAHRRGRRAHAGVTPARGAVGGRRRSRAGLGRDADAGRGAGASRAGGRRGQRAGADGTRRRSRRADCLVDQADHLDGGARCATRARAGAAHRARGRRPATARRVDARGRRAHVAVGRARPGAAGVRQPRRRRARTNVSGRPGGIRPGAAGQDPRAGPGAHHVAGADRLVRRQRVDGRRDGAHRDGVGALSGDRGDHRRTRGRRGRRRPRAPPAQPQPARRRGGLADPPVQDRLHARRPAIA